MEFTPDPLQTLFLWRLLADDGGAFLSIIKPRLTPASRRKKLESAGFIEVVRKKNAQTGGTGGFVLLTDAGWEWCAAHLDAEIQNQSTAAGPILQALMTKLKGHLTRHNVSLADFIQPAEATDVAQAEVNSEVSVAEESAAASEVSVAASEPSVLVLPIDRVRRVCDRLAQHQRGVRIYLADVRRELADLDRATLDLALRDLERNSELVLYPLDNPQEIRPQDAEAALINTAGQPRHIAYLQ